MTHGNFQLETISQKAFYGYWNSKRTETVKGKNAITISHLQSGIYFIKGLDTEGGKFSHF